MNPFEYYKTLGIDEGTFDLGEKTEKALAERFAKIDRTAELCQLKVIAAMQKNRVNADRLRLQRPRQRHLRGHLR